MDGFNNVKISTGCLTEDKEVYLSRTFCSEGLGASFAFAKQADAGQKGFFSGENGKTQVCPIGGC